MHRRFRQLLLAALLLPSLAGAQDRPPGLSFASLLNNIQYQTDKCYFTLGNQMQATFIAPNTKGWVILSKSDGTELYRYDFETQEIKTPYTLLDFNKTTDLRLNKTAINSIELKETGEYVLSFYLDKGKFYTFPFSIKMVPSPDPFQGGDLHFLDGDWENWAYLMYPGADPEQNLLFKVWLRHEEHSVLGKDAKIVIQITRDKDKKVVCESREGEWTLPREWQRFEFDMVFPTEKTAYGQYFKTKDLLVVDGAYTIKMKINGTPYGSWNFAVAGGKLNYTGRTERGKADPLTFIEGGRDAWWYMRKK
jgi:hypothetical protein